MTMIEKVARVLFERLQGHIDQPAWRADWEMTTESLREDFRVAARAAIEAMREHVTTSAYMLPGPVDEDLSEDANRIAAKIVVCGWIDGALAEGLLRLPDDTEEFMAVLLGKEQEGP